MAHRILVLGGGSIGTRHAKNLLDRGAGDVMIVDPDEARRTAAQQTLKIKAESNEDRAFETFKPDIVFVCSPSAFHVPQALKATERSAHVFIEKPLSHTLDGADHLRTVASATKRIVMVGCNMRFHPGPAAIKRLLDQGAIGEPIAARIAYRGFLPSWRPEQDYTKSYSASVEQGGAVLDCIHEIDLALWYFGPGTVEGSAVVSASSIGLKTDGLAEILLRHNAGTLSSIHMNFIERAFCRRQHIAGTEGSLTWDYTKGAVERTGADGKTVEVLTQSANFEANHMYIAELDHFLDAVDRSATPMGSLDEAIRALEVALAVSSRT